MTARLGSVVAGALAGVLLLCVLSIAVLAGLDRTVPGVLENLAAGALGALAALLARVGGAEDVRVVNRGPAEAVPVEGDAGYVTPLSAWVVIGVLLAVVVACVLLTA